MSDPADDLAAALAAGDPGIRLRQAVVQTADPVGWTATVLLSGSAVPAGPLPCLGSYLPLVGDTVQVLVKSAASMLVLGPAEAAPRPGWQIRGGNGLAMANGGTTPYGSAGGAFVTVDEATQCTVTSTTPVSVSILVDGEYHLEFSVPVHDGGTAASWTHYVHVDITRAAALFEQVITKQHSAGSLGVQTTTGGKRRLRAGDTVTAFTRHTAGVSLNVDDPSNNVTFFNGRWLGP